MKRVYSILIIFILALSMPLFITNVKAIEKIDYTSNNIKKMDNTINANDRNDDADCRYILGDPNSEASTAYFLQKIFDYIKIIGPLLVIILSGYDFARNALSPDADKMKKATSKLITRLLCAIGLFFVPMIASFIINLINNTSYINY